MADDTMKRRREIAARAFAERRRELGLTQEQVAQRGGIVVRTVQGFEAGRWPNHSSRARLEEAVGWAPGEIDRVAGSRSLNGDNPDAMLQAMDRLQEQLDLLREQYRQSQRKTNGHDGDGAHRAG